MAATQAHQQQGQGVGLATEVGAELWGAAGAGQGARGEQGGG